MRWGDGSLRRSGPPRAGRGGAGQPCFGTAAPRAPRAPRAKAKPKSMLPDPHGHPTVGHQWSRCSAAPQPLTGLTGAHVSFGKSSHQPPQPPRRGAGEPRVSAAVARHSGEE